MSVSYQQLPNPQARQQCEKLTHKPNAEKFSQQLITSNWIFSTIGANNARRVSFWKRLLSPL